MSYNVSREREAGRLYLDGAKAVSDGDEGLQSLALHLVLMIKGTAHHPGALWRVRELRTGEVRTLDSFRDYLLKGPRDGLGIPSLYYLQRALDATPQDGKRALAMVRAELKREGVPFDAEAKDAELRLHSESEPISENGEIGGGHNRSNNIRPVQHGTSAAYLAARLKRDRPDLSEALGRGEFRSVRAAAIEAGIIHVPTTLEGLRKLWTKATEEERAAFLAEIERTPL